MDFSMLIEPYGYLGSALVVISMLMSSVVKLRIINILGSIISGSYALIIGSFPLVLMNGCLIVINLYNLRKLRLSEQHYDLVECKRDDAFLAYFLNHYREDIAQYFPDFRSDDATLDAAYLTFCNADPAGVCLGRKGADGTLDVALEYTTPMYRDCSAGAFLFAKLPDHGIRQLCFPKAPLKHIAYLEKMGFQGQNGTYTKTL